MLSLAKLDELIDQVQDGPTVLLMNKRMRREVNALIREADQATETVSDVFGRQIPVYAGIPISIIEDDAEGNPILGFTEERRHFVYLGGPLRCRRPPRLSN